MGKALIFSDIHSDIKALELLMDTEADYYFAAGDTVTWARGFDAVGKVLARRAEKVYVLPGNHESESDIAAFCRNFGFHRFHGQTVEIDGFHVAGLGYSNPTPFNTPGEYSEQEIAARLTPFAASVRRMFVERYSAEEIEQLAWLLSRLPGASGSGGCSVEEEAG